MEGDGLPSLPAYPPPSRAEPFAPRHTLAQAGNPAPRPLPARLTMARRRRRSGARPTARAAAAAGTAAASAASAASPASSPAVPVVPSEVSDVALPADTSFDDALLAAATPSDTHVALIRLRAEWPGDSVPELARLPPVILISQLYAVVADRTAVDRDVDAMRAANVVRYIKLTASGPNDFAVVLTNDLKSSVYGNLALDPALNNPSSALSVVSQRGAFSKHRPDPPLAGVPLDVFFDSLLPVCTQVSVSSDLVESTLSLGSDSNLAAPRTDYAKMLVRGGLLTLKSETDFWFAVPQAGPFLKMRRKGNTELLGILRRAPYREMLLSRLEVRRLRSSSFPAMFHIRDVVGSGAAESVATNVGTLIRIVRTSATDVNDIWGVA